MRGRAARDAFHTTRTFAPRRSLERPAPACACHAVWPPRGRFSTPFHQRVFRTRWPGYRSRAPLPPGTRFSLALATLADFCNLNTTHGHTRTSPRSSHASGALAPLRAGTNRCRLRWPFGALPHRGLRATTCRSKPRAETLERRRYAFRERCRACPPRGAPGTRVAGATVREVWTLAHSRSGQDPSLMPPRERRAPSVESRCLLPQRNPYATEKFDPLVHAGTAAPSRRLREGIARELARLCDRIATACL